MYFSHTFVYKIRKGKDGTWLGKEKKLKQGP